MRNVQKVLSQVAAMAWIRQYRAWILQTEDRRNPIRILEEYAASTLQVMTKDSPFSTVLVSGSDLEVLKTFVASDMAPVVITRSQSAQSIFVPWWGMTILFNGWLSSIRYTMQKRDSATLNSAASGMIRRMHVFWFSLRALFSRRRSETV